MSGDENDVVKIKRSWLKTALEWVKYIAVGIAALVSIYIALTNRITKVEAQQSASEKLDAERYDVLTKKIEGIEKQNEWIIRRLSTPQERRAR